MKTCARLTFLKAFVALCTIALQLIIAYYIYDIKLSAHILIIITRYREVQTIVTMRYL